MELGFEKWHGCRNDFIIFHVDARQDAVIESLRRQAAQLCSRSGDGIGADGLLIVVSGGIKVDQMPHKLLLFNSDGSEMAHCGNGVRCAGASAMTMLQQDLRGSDVLEGIDLQLKNRDVFISALVPFKSSDDPHIVRLMSAVMGTVQINEQLPWYHAAKDIVRQHVGRLDYKFIVDDIGVCDIGNKHIVIFTRDAQALSKSISELGQSLQESKHWDGINVHIAMAEQWQPAKSDRQYQALTINNEDGYRVAVWERGVGITQACGSGACAVAAIAMNDGMIERRSWLPVIMPGGTLLVKQTDVDDPIELAGPVQFVFKGVVDI